MVEIIDPWTQNIECPQRFTLHSKSGDLEVLSHLTKMLYLHDFALDILSLHLKITDLVFEALELLHEYDCETIGMSSFE